MQDAKSAARHTTSTDVMHPGTMLLDAVRAWDDYPTPSATEYGSSQNGVNGKGGAFERPSAGTPSLSTAARSGALPGGKGVLNPVFVELLMGWPEGWTSTQRPAGAWHGFPPAPRDTEGWAAYLERVPGARPAVGRDEVEDRIDRLRACGNGVVPQQAAAAFGELFEALGVRAKEEEPRMDRLLAKTITLPPELEGLRLVVSVSGGKDSTAMMLALREAGIAFEAVFADTGWEAPETYAYLDMLREKIGPIHTVGFPGGMVAKIRGRAGFPARMQRWCTSELKTQPIRKYIDTLGDDVVSVVGVRAEESAARAKYAQLEDDHEWGGWIWRPILDWTVDEVIAIHNRNGIPVNPLYLRGHDRVGCFPCIFARKEEIRLIAEHAPWRIDEIRALEAEANVERARRNAEQPGRYSHDQTSYFQTRMRKHNGAMPIDQVVAWSRTDRKGLPILLDVPSGGCFRWGMCERPSQVPEPTETDETDETDEETDMGKKENELSTNDAVCTPPAIFEPIIAALGPIGFDPCSHPASNVPAATQVLLPTYWTDPDKPPPAEEQNGDTLILWGSGLDFHWGGMGLVYVNPPYSQLSREPWIQKARDEADEAVLLLPVRTAGVWWQESVAACQAITFLRGRVIHDGETVGAPFHQCLVYCGPRVERWLPHAVKLGWTVLGMPWTRGAGGAR